MAGEDDLAVLIRSMSPRARPGAFAFVSVADPGELSGLDVVATVAESEGLSAVVPQTDADRVGLDYDFVAGWITLEVQSSLTAIGLTAAVSTRLTEAAISCNVIAGRHHDHLLVPIDQLAAAVAALEALAAGV